MLADKHPNQKERLDSLESYEVLDTQDEADFDDIVSLASHICDTPVSLISLVDDDRQWFKAKVGCDFSQTTLEESICSHAILQDDALEIGDLAKDPRTADNPLHLGDENVNFYAGANLVTPDGMPLGTLCVLDTKPRTLTEFQRQSLKTLSRQVMAQLELRKKLKIEEALRDEIDHRVKNSLQTISSVLRLAMRKVSDPDAKGVLELVERRITAVASLHAELMGHDGSGLVGAKEYVDRVGNLLGNVCPENVSIVTKATDGLIDGRKASAVGMIASEFAANAMKHAFPDERVGKVEVVLENTEGNEWILSCHDNGVGRDSAVVEPTTSSGLGDMLMASAAMQLDGKLEQTSGPNGTALQIFFKS